MDTVSLFFLYKILSLIIGFGTIYLGYKLFLKGYMQKQGEVSAQSNKFIFKIKQNAPGVIFCLLGVFIIIFTAVNSISQKKYSERMPPSDNPTVKGTTSMMHDSASPKQDTPQNDSDKIEQPAASPPIIEREEIIARSPPDDSISFNIDDFLRGNTEIIISKGDKLVRFEYNEKQYRFYYKLIERDTEGGMLLITHRNKDIKGQFPYNYETNYWKHRKYMLLNKKMFKRRKLVKNDIKGLLVNEICREENIYVSDL